MTRLPFQVEMVAEDLQHCVAYGATAERLALHPALRALVVEPGLASASPVTIGGGLQRIIEHEAIPAIDQPVRLFGRSYPAPVMQRALRLELAFDGQTWIGYRRRAEVIVLLGTGHSVSYWSKADGPERALMRVLAEKLLLATGGAARL